MNTPTPCGRPSSARHIAEPKAYFLYRPRANIQHHTAAPHRPGPVRPDPGHNSDNPVRSREVGHPTGWPPTGGWGRWGVTSPAREGGGRLVPVPARLTPVACACIRRKRLEKEAWPGPAACWRQVTACWRLREGRGGEGHERPVLKHAEAIHGRQCCSPLRTSWSAGSVGAALCSPIQCGNMSLSPWNMT